MQELNVVNLVNNDLHHYKDMLSLTLYTYYFHLVEN